MQRSLYIHLLSLLPWQGEEELCLQKSSSAAATSRRRHGDDGPSQRASEHDCTVRQTCRKGRRDVLFSHPTPPHPTKPHPPTAACVHSAVSEASASAWSKRRHMQSGLRSDTGKEPFVSDVPRVLCFNIQTERQSKLRPFYQSATILLHPTCDATNILLHFPRLSFWLGSRHARDMIPAALQSAPIMCLPLPPLLFQIKASY